jgi:hypothetical protein
MTKRQFLVSLAFVSVFSFPGGNSWGDADGNEPKIGFHYENKTRLTMGTKDKNGDAHAFMRFVC